MLRNNPPATRAGLGWVGTQTFLKMVGDQCLTDKRELLSSPVGEGGRTTSYLFSQLLNPCWSPTELVVKGEHKEFPLPPAPGKEFNFTNGMGMSYEAKHVRECLQKGKHVENRGGRLGG